MKVFNIKYKKLFLIGSYSFIGLFVVLSFIGFLYNPQMMNIEKSYIPPSLNVFEKLLYIKTLNYNELYNQNSYPIKYNIQEFHLLGTDRDGKDVLNRLVSSSSNYLVPGLVCAS